MADGDWKVVARRQQPRALREGSAARLAASAPVSQHHFDVAAYGDVAKDFQGRLERCHRELVDEEAPFWGSLTGALAAAGAPLSELRLVCYGIGPFGRSWRAQYQLACLLAIAHHCRVASVELFDPVLSDAERALFPRCMDILGLRTEGEGCRQPLLTCLSDDEHASRRCQAPTLLFMPHCNKELYDNLIAANASSPELLANCLLLGNDLSLYRDTVLSRGDRRALRHVLAASEAGLSVAPLAPFPPLFEAFNDTALHSWSREQASALVQRLTSSPSFSSSSSC
ncbi:MAG: hypothetical protein Q8P67_05805 [archaeon]|nr:hypothetical protein [archaeon]